MTRWEYKIVRDVFIGAAPQDLLNEYGSRGWELISIDGTCCVFKRPSSKPVRRRVG